MTTTTAPRSACHLPTLTAACTVLLGVLVPGGSAQAGWYAAPAVSWGLFAARPLASEPTPNYYGYGGRLAAGFSFGSVLDVGVFGQYLPGRLKSAAFGKDDASLVSYGGELALRAAESVYIGLRGGSSTYQLYTPVKDEELRGVWSGLCGGLSLGAVTKAGKQGYVQTSFDVLHHVLEGDGAAADKRRFDSFGISVSYMYITAGASLLDNTIFKDFLDSVIY